MNKERNTVRIIAIIMLVVLTVLMLLVSSCGAKVQDNKFDTFDIDAVQLTEEDLPELRPLQVELMSTTRGDNNNVEYLIEIGEHTYRIFVWGDDFEYTLGSHDIHCACGNRVAPLQKKDTSGRFIFNEDGTIEMDWED